jgi:hypothetical protein
MTPKINVDNPYINTKAMVQRENTCKFDAESGDDFVCTEKIPIVHSSCKLCNRAHKVMLPKILPNTRAAFAVCAHCGYISKVLKTLQ